MYRRGDDTQANYDVLRDCLCEPIVNQSRVHASNATRQKARGPRKKAHSLSKPEQADNNDAEELAEFIDVLHQCQQCIVPLLKRTI